MPLPSPRPPARRPWAVRALLGAVGQDAAFGWRVPRAAAVVHFLAALSVALLLVVPGLERPVARLLTAEDSVLQWLRLGAYTGAAVVATAVAQQLWGMGRDRDAMFFAFLAIGCAVMAWEEVPPGRTPGILVLATCLYGSAVPWLVHARGGGPSSAPGPLAVPPLFLTSAFFVAFAGETAVLALGHAGALGEWAELCLALAVVEVALLGRMRVRRAMTLVVPILPAPARRAPWAGPHAR